jgi:quinol monooxygenase YgiN
MVALWSAASPLADEKVNPIEKEIKASLKDPTKPFVLHIHFKVKEGAGAKMEEAFAKARKITRKEKGNLSYNLTRSATIANEYVIYERWENFAAMQEHMKAPHTVALLKAAGEMLDGAPQVKVYIPTRE